MADRFAKVAVIGAGVMGGGIAAQIANAGVPVLLLDIVPPGRQQPQRVAERRDRENAQDRAGAVHVAATRRGSITPGNIEDDLAQLADCDWIVEAVLEKLEIKQATLSQDRGGAQGRARSSPPTPRRSR